MKARPSQSNAAPGRTRWRRGLAGDFDRVGLRRYLGGQAAVFWALILLTWLAYPSAHHFSILTHTFSFLGSYNPEHNPRYWWLFSVAMGFWAVSELPVVAHLHRAFARGRGGLAWLGSIGLVAGCAGLLLVGLFPDVRAEWRNGIRYTQVHTGAALLVAVGFGAGLVTYLLIWLLGLLRRALGGERRAGEEPALPGRVGWPLLFWCVCTGTCVFMVLRWERVYAGMKLAAASAGRPIGSAWVEGLKTWYAFPLWENLAIDTLYLSLVWLALTVRRDRAVPGG